MKYINNEKIQLGDCVSIDDKIKAVVVAIINRSEYRMPYNKNEWQYLKQGILVETETIGLLYIPIVDENLCLIKRENNV